METPVFATDIRDLTIAFKTMCEASKLTSIGVRNEKNALLLAIDETIKKYRAQLKEGSNQ